MNNPIPNKLANSSLAQIVATYNEAASALGRPAVSRFSDRATAEKRTAAILQDIAAAVSAGDIVQQDLPEHDPAAPEVQTKSGDPAVTQPVQAPDLGGVSPGTVTPVGSPPKVERQKAAAKDAIKAKPTSAAAVKSKPGAGLPVASADLHKDGQMPALRRALKPTNLKPKPKVYARKAGSKQALLVDLLARAEGATFGELFDAMASQGTPWQGTTVRAGLAWDINHVAGYGVASTAHTGEEFAAMGRRYEAERLGVVFKNASKDSDWKRTDVYDPDFKLLVYRLTYPAGMDAPVPHTPRPGPSAEQKVAAKKAMDAELKAAVDAKKAKA